MPHFIHRILLPALLAAVLLCTGCRPEDTPETETEQAEPITPAETEADTETETEETAPAETASEPAAESSADAEVPDSGETETPETEDAETAALSIPEVHIKLTIGAAPTDYRPAEYRFVDTDGRELNISGTIKVRGNSSSTGAKKPFNLKFDRKASVFGMERDKRWVLLANLYDKSALRNKMALDFAENLSFAYTTDSMYVNVYINNIYMGLYLLCEDINVSEKRVAIDIEDGDFMLELESVRHDPGEVYVASVSDMRFKIKYPEPEDVTDEQVLAVRRFLVECDIAAASKDMKKISAIFDVDSFVDYYVMNEVFKDVDGKYSSANFCVIDGKVYAGPVWDYDLCCGNASIFYMEDRYQSYHNIPGQEGTGTSDSADAMWMQFGWFELLLRCEEFKNLVTERYKELYPVIINQFLDNELGQNKIDRLIAEYGDVIAENNVKWDVSVARTDLEWLPTLKNYDDYIIFYRNWFIRRINYLNDYFGVEDTLPDESPYTADTGE